MQILHGCNVGGMEMFCINLANALSVQHEVVFLGSVVFEKYLSEQVIFQSIDIKKSRNNPFFFIKLYRQIKQYNPDIIHIHKQKTIKTLKRLSYFLSIPQVVTKHDMQKKKAFYNLDYAVSISDEVKKTIRAKKIFNIYNGIPYIKPKKIDISEKFNIVAVGGLRKVKGFDELIKSVSFLPFDFHLSIIGEGEERGSLEELISNLNISDKISLLGFKSNIQDYLFSADLQIISSLSEGFSLTMIEGVFYSKILISTRVSGCNEILSQNLLFDRKDMVSKMMDVYENYDTYKKDFFKVKNKYKEGFNIKVCADNYISVFKSIISEK